MSKASMHSFELGRARSSTPIIDKCAIVPISACVYASIVSPLLHLCFSDRATSLQSIMEPRWENRIFWPAMAAISVVLAVRNRSRLTYFASPHHLSPRVSCVCWSKRPVGFQTGALVH